MENADIKKRRNAAKKAVLSIQRQIPTDLAARVAALSAERAMAAVPGARTAEYNDLATLAQLRALDARAAAKEGKLYSAVVSSAKAQSLSSDGCAAEIQLEELTRALRDLGVGNDETQVG